MQDTWIKVETERQAFQALKDINIYLDELASQGKKERLALDIETYICKEARDHYDLQYSIKKQKKKEKDAGILTIVQAPKYPIPYPCINSEGIIEGRIRLIQVGLDPKYCDVQYIFDLDRIYEDYCTNVYESNLVDILQFYKDFGAILAPTLNRASLLGQFLKYEARNFIGHMGIFLREFRDLWIMSKVRYAGNIFHHGLGEIYGRQIEESLFRSLTGRSHEEYKEFKEQEQQSPWWAPELTYDQYKYAAEDVRLVWWAFDTLYSELESWANIHDTGAKGTGIFEIVKLECSLINILALMENTGMPFSVEEYEREAKPLIKSKMEEAQQAVDSKAMRTKKTIKKKKRTVGKGKDKVIEHYEDVVETVEPYKLSHYLSIRELTGLDEETLEKTGWQELFFFKDQHWAVEHIIQFKKYQKLHGFFESNNPKSSGYLKVLGKDGRVRSSYNQLGADSGRLSGLAPNLMQVSREKYVRKCFKAPKGWKLLIGDIPQAEPRLTTQETNDSFYRDTFENHKDMHWETAKRLFGAPEIRDENDEDQTKVRYHSKTIRLAKTYLMGFNKFIRKLYVDSEGELDYILRGEEGEKECKKVSDDFDALSPGVSAYIKEIENSIEAPIRARGSFVHYKNGKPFHVAKSILGRTREFVLQPFEKAQCKAEPEKWGYDFKVWVDETYDEDGNVIKEGYWSKRRNRANTKIRDTAREAFNNRMQSSQADGFKCGMVESFNDILTKVEEKVLQSVNDCVMINCVHDEGIWLCKEEYAEVMAPILGKALERGFRRVLWDTTIPLEIKVQICDSWAEKN
jgi:DNA polymerase I-like protein with 3'-5' exonuclease and polymerase domains